MLEKEFIKIGETIFQGLGSPAFYCCALPSIAQADTYAVDNTRYNCLERGEKSKVDDLCLKQFMTSSFKQSWHSLKISKLEDLCQTLSIYLVAVYDCSPCFILPRDVTVSPQFATQWETSSMLAFQSNFKSVSCIQVSA